MSAEESRYLEPLQLAGQIIMENGGETYRVEETVTRMGRAFGLDTVESFAVPSGVFVSYEKSDGSRESGLKRVRRGGTNLMRVDAVNAVSRQVEAGQLDCAGALARLRSIRVEKSPYSHLMLILAAAVCSGGFCLMFRGSALDCLLAGLMGALAQGIGHLLERFRMQSMVATLLESFTVATLPAMFNAWVCPILLEAVVAGALMPLLPGLSMTNAVQDAMRGDTVSGISHALSALLIAGLIAGGTLAASSLMRLLLGGAL